jgi:Tol biopolymer transport system component
MRLLIAALLLLAAAPSAFAQLSIEITGAGAQRLPIAIAPFAGEGALPAGISTIVRADLERSGLFRGIEGAAAQSRAYGKLEPQLHRVEVASCGRARARLGRRAQRRAV